MALSRRFKDCLKEFTKLDVDFRGAQQILASAQSSFRKLKSVREAKISEILKELDSTLPVIPLSPERVVEVDGKVYLITNSPPDVNTEFPSYIREIKVER